MKNIGLYIHVPFCSGKCPYCDFYSVAATEEQMDRYTSYLADKLASYKGRYHADTVYFGGGTPSLLGTERLCTLLDAARDAFFSDGEITIEVNPRSAMQLDFTKLSQHGLNRVSMGLQSANERELRLLGRRHTAQSAEEAFIKIKSEGIDNISLDLMLGIGGQTENSLARSIDFCASLGAKHISAYILKIEEGTPYFKKRDSLDLPDEDSVCSLYEYAVERLAKHGYEQYEISNFAKSGYESRHNLKYWHCEEYLGLGPAAHSFIDGKRFFYSRSLDDFYNDISIDDGEGGGIEEYISLALRLGEGLVFEKYEARFNDAVPAEYIENAVKLKKTGLVDVNDKGITITPKGFLVSNTLIADILYG